MNWTLNPFFYSRGHQRQMKKQLKEGKNWVFSSKIAKSKNAYSFTLHSIEQANIKITQQLNSTPFSFLFHHLSLLGRWSEWGRFYYFHSASWLFLGLFFSYVPASINFQIYSRTCMVLLFLYIYFVPPSRWVKCTTLVYVSIEVFQSLLLPSCV